jgi:hypothetical protein
MTGQACFVVTVLADGQRYGYGIVGEVGAGLSAAGSGTTGGRMPKKPRLEAPSYGEEPVDPPYRPVVKRPVLSRHPLAEPKAQRQLLALLGTNATMVVMCGLLVVVVAALLVLLVLKL